MFKKWFVVSLIVIIGFSCSTACWAGEHVTIEIMETAEVTDKEIHLKDIAKIFNSDDPKAIETVYLGSAALPGSSRRLTVGQIEVRLRQAGIDPRTLNIIGSKEVWVSTLDINQNVSLKSSSSPPDTSASNVTKDTVKDTAPGTNLIKYQVVVPIRKITRHELISREDLRVEEREGQIKPSNLAGIEDLVGKRATRLLTAGNYLTVSAAEVPPVVERQEHVMILVQAGLIQVTAAGQAKDSGGLGDIIAVENLDSKQIVYGKIINSELVKVEIGGLK